MFSMTSINLGSTLLNFVVLIHCASELPTEENYGIVVTERVIRNTVNNLFSSLILKVPEEILKLNKLSTMHNVFAGITLQDDENLKKIAKLTQLDYIDNGTTVFITQLNEVLNEDIKSDEAPDSVYVTILIRKFLNKLDSLKEKFYVNNNTKLFDINKAIVRHFTKVEKEFGNTTNLKEKLVEMNNSNYNVLSNNDFWQPSGRRIYQGKSTKIKRFPFMASILFFDRFQCAGSIVKADLIITSASCLQLAWNNRLYRENPSFLSVHVGSNYYKQGGENIPVMEIYFHPTYNPKSLRNNIALMRLTKVLKFRKYNRRVKMIAYDKHPSPLPANIDGIVVVGWGATGYGNMVKNPLTNKLTYAILDFYPLSDCQEIYSREYVTEKTFCAGFYSKGGGACNHDAGGPGISVGSGILLGVISFGSPLCGTPDAPTVFTKLGYYTDWIEKIMEMEIVTRAQYTTIRPLRTFRPTFLQTISRITPVIEQNEPNSLQSTQPEDILRMNEKENNFKEFLKTIFKKKLKKRQKEIQQEQEIKVTDYLDKSLDVKEQQTTGDTNNQSEIKEKEMLATETNNHSKEDSRDETTTMKPSTTFKYKQEITTTLHDNDPNYSKTSVPSFKHWNKNKENMTSDQELDDATDSLNINYFLESEEDSFEVSARAKPQRVKPKQLSANIESKTNLTAVIKDKEKKPRNLAVNKNLYSKDKDYGANSGGGSDSEENGDSEMADRILLAHDAENHKADEKEHSPEINITDTELSYDSDTAEEVEFLSIPAGPLERENSSSGSTERLIDMLDYEDVVKLLVEEVIQ